MASKIPKKHPEYIQTLLNSLSNNDQLTTMQYESVIRYLSKQRNEQMNLDLGEDAPRPLCICGGRPIHVFDLPELVIKHIFNFLPAKDMINVQMVCEPWKVLTMNTLMWKHAPLFINSDEEFDPFKVLSHVPYLHTISGYCEDGPEFFDALMENVLDLRRMECSVYCFLGSYFEDFLKKYKNIEYIEINNDISSDFVDSLDILSSCPNLKGLNFLFYEDDEESFTEICNTIENGFSSLRELGINRIDGGGYPNALCKMLQKKISQLTYLTLYQDINSNILEIVFKSPRLENLEIVGVPEISLNISNMKGLKSLTLQFAHDSSHSVQSEEQSVNVYKELVFPRNIEYLKLSFADVECSRLFKGIISNVIMSLPNLKSLVVGCIIDHDIDLQLEKISNLQNLHTASIHHCPHFTAKGVEHITKCTELRKLEISELTFTHSTYECLQKCTYLADLDLRTCVLSPDKLLPTILSMKYLTSVRFINCCIEKSGEKLKASVVEKITQECRREKHYVNIRC